LFLHLAAARRDTERKKHSAGSFLDPWPTKHRRLSQIKLRKRKSVMLSPGNAIAQADLADLLPPLAGEYLRTLLQRTADARAPVDAQIENRNDAQAAKRAAQVRIRHIERPPAGGLAAGPGHPSHDDATRQLNQAVAKHERVVALLEARVDAWNAAARVSTAAETWARDHLASGLRLTDMPVEPTLKKGETTIVSAVERLRHRLRELGADRHRIASAPYPSTDAKKMFREQVTSLAAGAGLHGDNLVEHGQPVRFPTKLVSAVVHVPGATAPAMVHVEIPDTLGMLAAFAPQLMTEFYDRLIDEAADDKAALTLQQRREQDAEIAADMLAIEREEAALIFKCWEQGVTVEHRADADPRALLAVAVHQAVEQPAAPSTRTGWFVR
jgi:hypothetical protein